MPRWYLYSTLEEEKKKKMDDVCKITLQSETRGQNKKCRCSFVVESLGGESVQ